MFDPLRPRGGAASCAAVLLVFSSLSSLATLGFAPGAGATTIMKRSLTEMAAQADRILEVRVDASSAADQGGGRIYTTYRLEVLEVLWGPGLAEGDEVEIQQPGGEAGGTRIVVPGIPHYRVGDEALVFSRDYGGGFQSVANAFQGSLPIVGVEETGADGRPFLRRELPEARALFPELDSNDLLSVKQRIQAALAAAGR